MLYKTWSKFFTFIYHVSSFACQATTQIFAVKNARNVILGKDE